MKTNYISMLTRHYVALFILPIIFLLNYIIKSTLYIEDMLYDYLYKIFSCVNIAIIFIYLYTPSCYLLKKQFKKTACLILIPIVVCLAISNLFDKHNINPETISYYLHKNEYKNIFISSNSIATDDGRKLVKIILKNLYLGCERSLIYDESNEMDNPHGNFRGVNFLTSIDINGNKYQEEAYEVTVKKIEDFIYIVNLCPDMGL